MLGTCQRRARRHVEDDRRIFGAERALAHARATDVQRVAVTRTTMCAVVVAEHVHRGPARTDLGHA